MKTKLLFALMCGVLGAVGLVFVQLISFFCIYPCFLREADLILILSSCLFLLLVTNARPSAEVENVTGMLILTYMMVVFLFSLILIVIKAVHNKWGDRFHGILE